MVDSDLIYSLMVRFLKYFLAIALLIIVTVSIAGVIIAWYYQDDVKQLMISEINKHVKTEVTVEDVSFSVLRKFPQASLEFRNVLIKVPQEYVHDEITGIDSDTLFTAKSLFLQFNIRDIFGQEYKINSIHAVNGVIYLAVNADEQENFRFWESSETTAEGFNIDLQDVRLNNYRFKFASSIKEIYFDSDIRRLEMKGNFSQASFRLGAIAIGVNREFRHPGIQFSGSHEILLKVALNVSNNLVSIQEGIVEFAGIKLSATGYFERDEPGRIDMDLKGYNLNVASVIPMLPLKIKRGLSDYKFKGKFDFEASVFGQLSKSLSPALIASFDTRNFEIIRENTGMRLTGITLSGNYSSENLQDAASSNVVISHFFSVFGKGSLSGSGKISNFSRPVIDLDVNASFLLEELAEFYKPVNIIQMSGRINTLFSVNGALQTMVKWDIKELSKMDLDGMMEIENGILEIARGKHIASNIIGELYFGRSIRTPGLDFNIGSDHFSISGEIFNGLPWLLGDDHTMSISGSLFSKKLNLDNYLLHASASQDKDDISESLRFPSNLELNLDFLIDDLSLRKFSSSGFSGKLSYKPRMMVLNAVDFDAMDGSIYGNGVIHQKHNGDFMVQSQLQLRDVDMQKMFCSFNDFGQTFIQRDNLKGTLTGSLGLISEWSSDLKIKRETIIADSKVEILSGELIDFEPMLGLASFIDVSELQHIHFSTLKNEIFIRNQVVTIPQMDINSSAFNISGSGTHRFDGHFDYRLRVLLSDVLYGKAARAKQENQEFGIVEDDGLGRTSLYLLVSGTSDNYRVSYDRMAVRDVIRENIENEKNVLRQMLHEEFGWFSSDSSVVTEPGSTGSSGSILRIIWDEEDEKPSPETLPEPPSGSDSQNKERRFRIIWDEDKKPN